MKWLGERGRDGGIDTVPLPVATGGLSMCGKHAIGPDPLAAMEKVGATTVVCLVEERELAHWPEYVQWLRTHQGQEVVWFPIHDLHAPPLARVEPLLDELVGRIGQGEHLLLHCAAGIGRTGTIGACLLIELGMQRDAALELVRASRPMAGPEVGAQMELVNAVAARRAE